MKACTSLVVERKDDVDYVKAYTSLVVERNDDADYVKACTSLVVERKAPVGRPRKTWQNTPPADMRLLKVDPRDVHNRKKWWVIGWCKTNQAASGTWP